MAQAQTTHIKKAKDYLAKGEAFYAKAAQEIRAAFDGGMTYAAIGRELGRGDKWVRTLAKYDPASRPETESPLPFSRERMGDSADRSATKKILTTAPLEQVERIVMDLPPERQREIANVAHNVAHSKLHDARHEKEMNRPPEHERKANEAAFEEEFGAPVRKALGSAVLSPDAYIQSAIGIMERVEQTGAEISNYDECVELLRILIDKMWTYGAMRGFDVSQLADAARRIGEEE